MTVPFILGGFAVGLVVFLWITGPWRRGRKARARPTEIDLDKLYGFEKSTTFIVPPSEGLRNVQTFGGDHAYSVTLPPGETVFVEYGNGVIGFRIRDARGRFLKGGNPARDEKGRFV